MQLAIPREITDIFFPRTKKDKKASIKFSKNLLKLLEGWDGEGDGREFQKGGDICIPMADSC